MLFKDFKNVHRGPQKVFDRTGYYLQDGHLKNRRLLLQNYHKIVGGEILVTDTDTIRRATILLDRLNTALDALSQIRGLEPHPIKMWSVQRVVSFIS
jgi:hypothetical protein